MRFDELSNRVIGSAIEVHRVLGPGSSTLLRTGLLESTYEQCLARELTLAGLGLKLQWPLPVDYKGTRLDCGYRGDVLVEDRLIVELKAVEHGLGIHQAQLLTYMRLTHIRTGLLINFNVAVLKDGLQRFVL